jgi:hypothetical protein
MVDRRNRNSSLLTEIVDGGDFGFRLQSWHESLRNSCYKLDVIDESHKISLDKNQAKEDR